MGDLHLLFDIGLLWSRHPCYIAFDAARFENDHAVIWVSSEYMIIFLALKTKLGLPVIILNNLRYLVLYQTHPILIRILELQVIVRPIPYNLGPFHRALVAQDTLLWNGVDIIVAVILNH